MCVAKGYAKQIESTYKDASKEYKQLRKQLSKFDIIQQDILHEIETGNFNAAQGYMMAKSLQNIRKERRKVKVEMEGFNKLFGLIKRTEKLGNIVNSMNQYEKNMEKKYENVDVLYKCKYLKKEIIRTTVITINDI